jgi:hypothetical protein
MQWYDFGANIVQLQSSMSMPPRHADGDHRTYSFESMSCSVDLAGIDLRFAEQSLAIEVVCINHILPSHDGINSSYRYGLTACQGMVLEVRARIHCQ